MLPAPAAAQPQAPGLAPNVVIDGPSPDIVALDGLSIARDGTGGIVYLKDIAGVAHVFASPLAGGSFQPPEQIDTAFSGPSSQPVIAAGNGGVLLIGFINGGSLWVVDRAGSAQPFLPAIELSGAASNPAISITNFGKAYLAFATAVPGGSDVRAAYYDQGTWALEPTPLNDVAGDDAGTGAGRPAVAAAGDGVAIVVWGENGHIYSRRVWATAPSVVDEQADPPALGGWTEVTADQPSVGAGGDSSYANVVFREQLSDGSQTQERVLMNRLHGSVDDGVTQPDGLSTPGSEGADQPQVADSEYGNGLVLAAHDVSDQVWATELQNNGIGVGRQRVDSLQNMSAPDATAGMDGLYSGLVTWQHDPGTLGVPEIRARYYNGSGFGPEIVLSTPALGPTDAALGLFTTGDVDGDAAVVWIQGAGSATQIVAAQLYQPPGPFAPSSTSQYVRTTSPTLSWSTPQESWGIRYTVTVDGVQVAQTSATGVTVPTALTQGPHTWQVSAINPAGLTSTARAASVFVDTLAPVVSFTVAGLHRARIPVLIHVTYSDTPPGLPASDGSGVASVTVRWGDRAISQLNTRRNKFHVYKRAGRYPVTVTVTDRAGNKTTVSRLIRIQGTPKRKRRRAR
ncbi:MAG: hypothetical protein ABSG43_10300 [Solirubrobacteraceae bacterium]